VGEGIGTELAGGGPAGDEVVVLLPVVLEERTGICLPPPLGCLWDCMAAI
jgi:hypothetical protein